jgi:small subunit ribosomal protein S20
MPIIKSAKKRVKVAAKAGARNSRTRRNLRDALKAFAKAIEGKKTDQIAKTQQAAISAVDMAAKKAVIHKNKAARYKSQLAREAKSAGVKQAASPKPKAKSQKATVKKSVAKKPAAKKPVSKKPATRK